MNISEKILALKDNIQNLISQKATDNQKSAEQITLNLAHCHYTFADLGSGSDTQIDSPVLDFSKSVNVDSSLGYYASFIYGFYRCKLFKSIHIKNMYNIKNISACFFECDATEIETLDFTNIETVSAGTFKAPQLETIKFEPETVNVSLTFAACEKLTDESLTSIIEGLINLTDNSKTLTLSAASGEKLSDDKKALITQKGWTLVV